MRKKKEEEEFINLSRKERLKKAREMIFGEFDGEYMGNIWGWRFTMFSLVGLLLVGSLAVYGVMTGQIDPNEVDEDAPSLFSPARKDTSQTADKPKQ